MKIQPWALGLLLLFLPSCATQTVKPTADLEIIRLGVQQLTKPRPVTGPTQRRADAATNGELWQYAGAREDQAELSEGDKARVQDFVQDSIAAMKLARIGACGWFDFACRRARKAVQKESPQ